MNDVPGKFIGFIVAFFLCVVGPVVNIASQQEMLARRQVVMEMSNFIDEVTDSRRYTPQMRKALVAKINSHGVTVDFTIIKEQRSIDATVDVGGVDSAKGTAHVSYIRIPIDSTTDDDKVITFDTGDRIGIETHSIAANSTQYLSHLIAGMFIPEFKYNLYSRVR